MRPASVYCDRLGWRSALALLKARPGLARVLDPVPPSASAKCLRFVLALAGCEVREAEFFAGHLRGDGGEPLFMIARRQSSQLALDAARLLVGNQRCLAGINSAAGRNQLVLHIARNIWTGLERVVLQMHVAGLAAGSNDRAILYISRPAGFDTSILSAISARVELRYYGAGRRYFERARLIAWVLAQGARPLLRRLADGLRLRPSARIDPPSRPGLLLVQEDEVSPDRSYRTQPHWVAEDDRPPFPIYLVKGGPSPIAPGSRNSPDLTVLDDAALARIGRRAAPAAVDQRLEKDARRCLLSILFATTDYAATAYAIAARLLARARLLEKACRYLKIRAFLCGDPYLPDADAIQVFGPELGIATVAYQYSNVAFTNVMTATTSDHVLLFSPRFEAMWPYCGIQPRRMIATGYPFDAAFDRVRRRAAQWRRRLERAGARFIICYFDENVGPPSKYGFMGQSELDAEIRALARLVLADRDVGIIFKSQFRKRSPTVRLPDDPVLREAIATGRVIELCVGTHRNIVFPAEAALASDLAIGHLIGATAALEAALAGTRCVLINVNGTKTANDDLYARGQIVFESCSAALRAIALFRAGAPDCRALGDWSGFIHELDPFRDGSAATRLRGLLASLLSCP